MRVEMAKWHRGAFYHKAALSQKSTNMGSDSENLPGDIHVRYMEYRMNVVEK